MTTEASQVFSFDDVKVEPRTGEVFKAGAAVALEPKVFKLLVFLIENRDRIVEKEEILDVLWEDVNVTENSLASAVAKLRRTLGDDSKTGKYIQTLHARGYRFVANVEVENGSARDGQAETALGDSGGEQGSVSLRSIKDAATHVGPQNRARHSPGTERSPFAKKAVLAGILCTLLLGAGFYATFLFERTSSGAAGATTSIAVLPFQSAGFSGDDQTLGFEIADALTSKLSSSTHLSVRPAPAVLRYANLRDDPAAAGRALNVDYILQGNIQRSPGLVTVQLIRVRDAASLQTVSFNEKFTNIFQVEDSLSAQVLRALTVTLYNEEKPGSDPSGALRKMPLPTKHS